MIIGMLQIIVFSSGWVFGAFWWSLWYHQREEAKRVKLVKLSQREWRSAYDDREYLRIQKGN